MKQFLNARWNSHLGYFTFNCNLILQVIRKHLASTGRVVLYGKIILRTITVEGVEVSRYWDQIECQVCLNVGPQRVKHCTEPTSRSPDSFTTRTVSFCSNFEQNRSNETLLFAFGRSSSAKRSILCPDRAPINFRCTRVACYFLEARWIACEKLCRQLPRVERIFV